MLDQAVAPSPCASCPAARAGVPRVVLGAPAPGALITILHATPNDFRPGHRSMWDRHVGSSASLTHDYLLRCTNATSLKGADKQAAVNCCRAYDKFTTKALMLAGEQAWNAVNPAHLRYSDWLGYMSPGTFNGHAMFATLKSKDLFDTDRIVELRAHVTRVVNWLHGTWPLPLPTPVTGLAGLAAVQALVDLPARTVAVDTEFVWNLATVPGHHPLTMLGICWRTDAGDPVVAQFTEDWPVVLETFTALIAKHTIVCQNLAADIPVIRYNGGPDWPAYKALDDLMLAHAALYAGWPHDLKYLRSIGGVTNVPKVFREAHDGGAATFSAYNVADVYETLVLWESMGPLVSPRTGLHRTYRTLVDLVPIHTNATQQGVAVNTPAVLPAVQHHIDVLQTVLKLMEAFVGAPMSLTGKHFTEWLVKVEKITPVMHRVKKRVTWDKDAITQLRSRYLAVDTELEAKQGLTVALMLERIEAGAHPLLEARALYSRVYQSYTHYILPLLKEGSDELDGELGELTEEPGDEA
jgi:hypothetical protein